MTFRIVLAAILIAGVADVLRLIVADRRRPRKLAVIRCPGCGETYARDFRNARQALVWFGRWLREHECMDEGAAVAEAERVVGGVA